MISPTSNFKYYVATKPADFKKGMNGLAAAVLNELKFDPFSGAIFIFRTNCADNKSWLASVSRFKGVAQTYEGQRERYSQMQYVLHFGCERAECSGNAKINLCSVQRHQKCKTTPDRCVRRCASSSFAHQCQPDQITVPQRLSRSQFHASDARKLRRHPPTQTYFRRQSV